MDVCIKELKWSNNRSMESTLETFKNEVKLFSEVFQCIFSLLFISRSITVMYVCFMVHVSNQENGSLVKSTTILTVSVTELCVRDLSDLMKDKKTKLSLFEKLVLARDICGGYK